MTLGTISGAPCAKSLESLTAYTRPRRRSGVPATPFRMTKPSKGRAKLAMSQGISVWVLEAPDGFGDADFHAHHAIQITACLAGALTLTTADETLTAPDPRRRRRRPAPLRRHRPARLHLRRARKPPRPRPARALFDGTRRWSPIAAAGFAAASRAAARHLRRRPRPATRCSPPARRRSRRSRPVQAPAARPAHPADHRLCRRPSRRAAQPRRRVDGRLSLAEPPAPFVRRADRPRVQDLSALAAAGPRRDALCRGRVADRGGACGGLFRFGAFQPDLQAHLRLARRRRSRDFSRCVQSRRPPGPIRGLVNPRGDMTMTNQTNRTTAASPPAPAWTASADPTAAAASDATAGRRPRLRRPTLPKQPKGRLKPVLRMWQGIPILGPNPRGIFPTAPTPRPAKPLTNHDFRNLAQPLLLSLHEPGQAGATQIDWSQ